MLIPGVADAVAAQEPAIAAAVATATDGLQRRSDRIVIVTAGRRTCWTPRLPAVFGADPFRRSDVTGEPSAPSSVAGPLWAAGTWVGRRLLPGVALGVLEVGDGDGDGGVGLPTDMPVADDTIGVLVLADGATCHGAADPPAPDPAATSFEQSLKAALATGDPARLTEWCGTNWTLGRRLGATAPRSLAVLAQLMGGRRWQATAEYLGAPFGVGYHVASWWR